MFVVFDTSGRENNRHYKHALVGMFVVLTRGEVRERAGHRKHALQGVFWCSAGTAVAGRKGGGL
jgi:hypothetical protein